MAGMISPSFAQQRANASSIETVTVTANSEAPAIWHATRGDADVAILAIVQPLPDGFQWNTKPLEAILDTARLVLLPPHVEMGTFSGAWFYLTNRDLLHPPDGKTLWDILDPQAASRLADACNQLHEPRERYSDSAPIAAGINLGSDFRHVYDLTTHEPEDTIRELAHEKRVEVRRIANYDMIPSAKELLKLPPAQTGKCLEAATDDIAFQSRHAVLAANAWAIGDVVAMQANWTQPKFYDCLVALSAHAAVLDSRFTDDTVTAISDAMDRGGHSVAVVDIGILLGRNGVLDRLRSQGIAVAGPVKSVSSNQNSPG